MAVTVKNVVCWDVSPCGSCSNQRFGGTYRLHLHGENNQRTKNTLAIASNCSTLQRINHSMKKGEAAVSVIVFFRYCRYDRPLLCSGFYRTLLIWEVTTMAKYDMQGRGRGGGC
jgi:hypothetical protein